MNSFINALKRPPSWKSLFIFYTLFIFFIVQVALFENEIIEDLIEENYQLQNDLDFADEMINELSDLCLLYTSPSPRDRSSSRMPSSA